jgi:hypothetical protein
MHLESISLEVLVKIAIGFLQNIKLFSCSYKAI